MKKAKRALLGVCPIGKFVFSHEDAMVQKHRLLEKLDAWKVDYCDVDSVLTDGMVRDQKDVAKVVRYFAAQQIDALFIPHCNFGTEGAAGMIAKSCDVPTLLWGPRDDKPLADGSRLRDTLCGTLATSKVLHTLKVPFSYINNCDTDDLALEHELDRFVRAVRVAKAMKTMRIGQIGQRIDFFWTTITSEAELLRRFGVQVLPIDMVEFLKKVKEQTIKNHKAYADELKSLKSWIEFRGYENEESILYNFAIRDEICSLGEEHGLDGFALQTFSSIPSELGTFGSLGVSLANDAGYPVAAETDLHGAISSVLVEAASPIDEPSFFPDITIRHPDNDNAVLLWHVEAPLSLRDKKSKVRVDRPWILKGLSPGLLHFKLKDGPVTLCRFDGDGQNYRLGFGEGHTVEGPYTQEFYAWMEVNNWPRWERQLIEGPYIHHCSCVFDHCADALAEAVRFIPGLDVERFGA